MMVREVTEESLGFQDLFDALERELPIAPSWYREVMDPAFAANYRILFQRAIVYEPEVDSG